MGARPLLWTPHGRQQALARALPEELVVEVATNSESITAAREGREIRQRVVIVDARPWLVRVVVDLGTTADEIVTAYRTSRTGRYQGER